MKLSLSVLVFASFLVFSLAARRWGPSTHPCRRCSYYGIPRQYCLRTYNPFTHRQDFICSYVKGFYDPCRNCGPGKFCFRSNWGIYGCAVIGHSLPATYYYQPQPHNGQNNVYYPRPQPIYGPKPVYVANPAAAVHPAVLQIPKPVIYRPQTVVHPAVLQRPKPVIYKPQAVAQKPLVVKPNVLHAPQNVVYKPIAG